jgi:hypothetical protein
VHRLDQAAETRRYDVLHLHGFDENDGHFRRNFFQPDGFRLANVAPRASFRRLAEALPQGVDLVADAQRGGFGLRQEGADFPTGLPAAFPDGVGAENAEGIAVVSANYGFDFFWCHASLFVMECRAMYYCSAARGARCAPWRWLCYFAELESCAARSISAASPETVGGFEELVRSESHTVDLTHTVEHQRCQQRVASGLKEVVVIGNVVDFQQRSHDLGQPRLYRSAGGWLGFTLGRRQRGAVHSTTISG